MPQIYCPLAFIFPLLVQSSPCLGTAGARVLHPTIITVPVLDTHRSPSVDFWILLMPLFSTSKKAWNMKSDGFFCLFCFFFFFSTSSLLKWQNTSPVCISTLSSFLQQKLFAVSILKLIVLARFPVSSVRKWWYSLRVLMKQFLYTLAFFFLFYASLTSIKQWCPARHCSLCSCFLLRECPMCPIFPRRFMNSVKSSSSECVQ